MSDPIARLLALGGELTTRRKFDLEHMRVLLRKLGDPQQRFKSILIAGTNGKGSTAATLASILKAAGHRTCLYTSPHLERLNERVRIDGVLISDGELSRLFEVVESAAAELVSTGLLPHPPSFFEAVTAIAFLHFAAAGPSGTIAVLEVGLGGRLDAVNVVDPLVSVLTDISLDHQEWLGSTIAAITREKCGILRAGGLLITLPQHPEANQAIGEAAVPLGVEAVSAVDYLPPRGTDRSNTALRNQYRIACPASLGGGVLEIDSPLAGEHQQRNIALAVCTAVCLHERKGKSLTKHALEEGVRSTSWPGRLQLLRPTKGPSVLLDAAHNPAGAWALRAALASLPFEGPRTLIFGCMQDKAVDELAQVLFPVFDRVYVTRANASRAAEPARLAQAAARTGTPCVQSASAASALAAALAETPEDGLVAVAGSIALLGECFPLLAGLR